MENYCIFCRGLEKNIKQSFRLKDREAAKKLKFLVEHWYFWQKKTNINLRLYQQSC